MFTMNILISGSESNYIGVRKNISHNIILIIHCLEIRLFQIFF